MLYADRGLKGIVLVIYRDAMLKRSLGSLMLWGMCGEAFRQIGGRVSNSYMEVHSIKGPWPGYLYSRQIEGAMRDSDGLNSVLVATNACVHGPSQPHIRLPA